VKLIGPLVRGVSRPSREDGQELKKRTAIRCCITPMVLYGSGNADGNRHRT
jgi:hypothetical protein